MPKSSHRKSFQRLVLLPEDMYRNALSCMAKESIEKATEETHWYEKDVLSGKLQPTAVPEDRTSAHVFDKSALNSNNIDASSFQNEVNKDTVPEIHTQVIASEPEITINNHKNVASEPRDLIRYKSLTGNRKGIPPSFRRKYDLLLTKLKNTEKLKVDSHGQLVLPTGHVIVGSNFHELFRYLFNTNLSTTSRPVGFESFVSQLRSEGIAPSEVISKAAKLALESTLQNGQLGKGVRNFRSPPPGKRVKILHVY